jgi:hypothetical protein
MRIIEAFSWPLIGTAAHPVRSEAKPNRQVSRGANLKRAAKRTSPPLSRLEQLARVTSQLTWCQQPPIGAARQGACIGIPHTPQYFALPPNAAFMSWRGERKTVKLCLCLLVLPQALRARSTSRTSAVAP